MALDPYSMNIEGVQQLIGSKTNKSATSPLTSNDEGVQGEMFDEFTLTMTDEELLKLSKKWELRYAPYESKIKPRQEDNYKYYLGRQKQGTIAAIEEGKGISANLLFESEETFLPAALSKNPEPVVWSDNSPQGNQVANDVKTMLQFHADILCLRRKLALMTRKWSLDFLGVAKHGWDNKVGDIKTEIKDAKNFVFDPSGYVDVYGDFIGYLGERITVSAERLVEMFPKHTAYITVMVDGKMGTEVMYTEWWTDEYTFYTFKNRVLDKHKNPHFNYDRNEIVGLGEEQAEEVIKGNNHFPRPKKPYTFLSVFSLGQQPHDETGLIEQNIPNQRLITRRVEQLDYNLSRANNSTAFSENNFTQETAKQAATAWTKGHPVLVPAGGPIEAAIKDFPAPSVPASFFQELENNMANLRSSFGVTGITASDNDKDETARGMILKQQFDNSRIGGGIGDVLEQVADNIFNWWVQMYKVYYDEPHYASIMGKMRATEYIELVSTQITARLVVSVAPNSMKPKDEISEMNQALSLWEAKAIDPLTLLTRLDFPSPKETAGMFMLYTLNPTAYFQMNWPDMAQLANPRQVAALGGQVPSGAGQTPAPASPTVGGVPPPAALNSVPLPA